MKLTPISVINEHLSDGAALEAFRGKLTKLYAMKTRAEGTPNQFTKQDGEMQGECGNTIKVEFRLDGQELDRSRVGVMLTVESTKTEKHGLKGVTVMDDTYQDKTTRKLKITKTANLTWADGGGGSSTQQQSTPSSTGTTQSAPQSKPNTAYTGDPRADGMRAGMCIGRACELVEAAGVTREYLMSADFPREVYFIASKLMLVAGRLEQGKLDPRVLPAKKEQPGPTEAEKAAAAEAAKKEEQLRKEREEREERRRLEDEEIARATNTGTSKSLGIDEDEIPF